MTIIAHGQTFTAHSCSICGAKDSNKVSLAAHEQWHHITSAQLAGRLTIKFGCKSWALRIRTCAETGCALRAKARGYCMKHYMRRKVKGEFGR